MIRFPVNLNMDKPQTKIFIVILSLIVLIIYFQLLLQPQLVRLADVFSNIGKLRADSKAAWADISKKDQFEKNIEAYKEKVEEYEKRLPGEQEIPSLLENLSLMARDSNIKILGITPVTTSLKEIPGQKSQIYREMPILISAKSGYHELGYFLSNLENADRFTKVVDIDIKANRLTSKKHDVELVVSTFILLKEK